MTSPDPSSWPDAPPPLPPVLPTGSAPVPPGWPAAAAAPPPVAPPGTPAPGSAPPPPRSPTRVGVLAAIIAVVVVLGVAATVVAVKATSTDDTAATATTVPASSAPPTTERADPPPTTSAPDPTTPGGTGAPGDVQAQVDEIAAFVEQSRGLTFTDEVPIVALGAEDFKARVLEEFEAESDSLETEGALLRAGGIVPADLDIVESQLELLGDGVLGFYDPITKELVVRSDSDGPLVRSVIAHELTHALDDQHADLDRPELAEAADGSDWAFLALVEGSAKRVENAYVAELDADDQEQLEADKLDLALDQMDTLFSNPLVLAQILTSPYDYGAPFVEQLVARGGTAALDDAFARPPTSSEQILHIERYDGDGPRPVEQPPADGEVIDQGVLGELFTGFLLAENAAPSGLPGGMDPEDLDELLESLEQLGDVLEDLDDLNGSGGTGGLDGPGGLDGLGGTGSTGSGFPPVATTDGWGGDHYVVWRSAGQVCLRVDWVMDTPEALATFRTTVDAWAARDAAVDVTAPTPESVRATRCADDLPAATP